MKGVFAVDPRDLPPELLGAFRFLTGETNVPWKAGPADSMLGRSTSCVERSFVGRSTSFVGELDKVWNILSSVRLT